MGLAEAIIIGSLISGGGAVIAAQQTKKGGLKGGQQIGQKDARKITKKDITEKGARAALVAGGAIGISSDLLTGGRGTLLGN